MPNSGTWRNLRHDAPSGAPIPQPLPSGASPPKLHPCFPCPSRAPLPRTSSSRPCVPPGAFERTSEYGASGCMHPRTLPVHRHARLSSALHGCFSHFPEPPPPGTPEPNLLRSHLLPEEQDDGISVMEHPAPHPTFPSLARPQLASPLPSCATRTVVEPFAPTRHSEPPGAFRAPLPLYPQPPIPYPSCTLPSPLARSSSRLMHPQLGAPPPTPVRCSLPTR